MANTTTSVGTSGATSRATSRKSTPFVHIGMYLTWIIQHDLHDEPSFSPEQVALVKAAATRVILEAQAAG